MQTAVTQNRPGPASRTIAARKVRESRRIKEGETGENPPKNRGGRIPFASPSGERERERKHTRIRNKRTYTPRLSIKAATQNKKAKVMSQNEGEGNQTDAGKNMDGQRKPFSTMVAPANGMVYCEEDLRKAITYINPAMREEIIRTYMLTEGKENKTDAKKKGMDKERSFNKSGLHFHMGWKTEKRVGKPLFSLSLGRGMKKSTGAFRYGREGRESRRP